MQFRVQTLLLFLGLFNLTLAYYAEVLKYSAGNPRSESLISDRASEDENGCRAKCSPGNRCCTTRNTRRDLTPRTLPVPGNIGDYVVATTEAAGTVQVVDGSNNYRNSAVFRSFGTAAVNVGLQGLCGCTALVVVNSHGVYFAHYFENLSFSDENNEAPDFNAAVIQLLLNGGNGNGDPNLQQHAGIFNDGETMVFIMAPRSTRTRPMYPTQLNQLKQAIRGILPSAQNAVVYLYTALDCKNDVQALEETSAGRALVQYDPSPPLKYRLYFEAVDQGIQALIDQNGQKI